MADGYFGKYSGVVKDNRDPDKLGRVQVSVPALFPPDELVQARPALPFGFFFVPENDAKVWVEFEGGDSALPLWTGVQVVSGELWATAADADPPSKRVAQTPAGHAVVFDDTSGAESITLTDGVNGHVVTLDRNGVKVTDAVNGNELALSSSGVSASTRTGAKVELTASGAAVDGGPGVVEVKGSLIKLSASATLPVVRLTDMGIGNLGAPVVITSVGNPTVLA
jgi:Type VI secretion system/phage-baseplate injector OB domain